MAHTHTGTIADAAAHVQLAADQCDRRGADDDFSSWHALADLLRLTAALLDPAPGAPSLLDVRSPEEHLTEAVAILRARVPDPDHLDLLTVAQHLSDMRDRVRAAHPAAS